MTTQQGVAYAVFDADGRYVATGVAMAGSPSLEEANVHVGQVDPELQYHTVDGPAFMPARPSPNHAFDFKKRRWLPDEKAGWALIRQQRTALLDAADKAVNRLEDKGQDARAWRQYRQALRDITLQADPFTAVWPEPPSA